MWLLVPTECSLFILKQVYPNNTSLSLSHTHTLLILCKGGGVGFFSNPIISSIHRFFFYSHKTSQFFLCVWMKRGHVPTPTSSGESCAAAWHTQRSRLPCKWSEIKTFKVKACNSEQPHPRPESPLRKVSLSLTWACLLSFCI